MNKTKDNSKFLSSFTSLVLIILPLTILSFFGKLINLILPKQLGAFRYVIFIALFLFLCLYITTKMFIPTIIEVIGPILLIIGLIIGVSFKKELLLARAASLSGLMLIILVPIILSLNFFRIGETYEDVARVGASHFFSDFSRRRSKRKELGLHVEGIGGAPDFLSNKKI